jgi:hypothetical protein
MEEYFNRLSWNDILDTVIQVERLNVEDELVSAVVGFVRDKNKISYKQWKVLVSHIEYVNRKQKKFKYGY